MGSVRGRPPTPAPRHGRRWRLRRAVRRAQPRHRSGGPADARRPAQLPPLPAAALPGRDRRPVARRHRPAAALDPAQAAQHDGHPRRGRRHRPRPARGPPGRRRPDRLRHARRRDRAPTTPTSTTPSGRRSRPGLKTIEDATEIRRRILIAFEAAEREADPERRRAWMTFVIVGGGPTGVELGRGARRDRPRHAPARLPGDPPGRGADRPRRGDGPDPAAVSAGPVGLGAAPARAARASRSGPGRGSSTSTRPGCASPDPTGPRSAIPTRTVLWAAGVLTAQLRADGRGGDRRRDRSRRPGHRRAGPDDPRPPGDLRRRRRGGRAVEAGQADAGRRPGRDAGRGVRGARSSAGASSGRPYEPFRYSDHGDVAVIGRLSGVTNIGWLGPFGRQGGFTAWRCGSASTSST